MSNTCVPPRIVNKTRAKLGHTESLTLPRACSPTRSVIERSAERSRSRRHDISRQ